LQWRKMGLKSTIRLKIVTNLLGSDSLRAGRGCEGEEGLVSKGKGRIRKSRNICRLIFRGISFVS